MHRLDSLRGDFSILRRMLRGMPRAQSHAQNLQAFYAAQAHDYDRFRERLLRGRADLIRRLPLPPHARVVELGGGTGRNLEFFAERLDQIAAFDVVDLCPALLAQARDRFRRHPQVRMIEADATTYRPDALVDCVYFSYSLTMIPDWRAALGNALAMLKPGGVLGVVDFYVSARRPAPGLVHHNGLTRAFWPRWFGHDGVRLDPRHLVELCERLPRHEVVECRTAIPYLPAARVPYYLFIGHKTSA
jgi:S-adenosylmethionine-diacylgycerolhomoserine-N-methlytransferase